MQTPSGKWLRRNRKNHWEDKSTATMNPEVYTPPPVASLESIRDSIVGITTHHTQMEQTSTVTTYRIYTPQDPNTHQGTQKTSRK